MKKLIFCVYLAIFTSVFSFCNEADDFLLSFVELTAEKDPKTNLIENAFTDSTFIVKIEDIFCDTVGIKNQGFCFYKILQDENFCLVMYKNKTTQTYKTDDNKKLYTEVDNNMFIILFNKKQFKIETAFFM